MTSYLACPQRKNGKVAIDKCLVKCQLGKACNVFSSVSPEVIEGACKRLKLPVPKRKERGPVIQVYPPAVSGNGKLGVEEDRIKEYFETTPKEQVEKDLIECGAKDLEYKVDPPAVIVPDNGTGQPEERMEETPEGLYERAMGARDKVETGFLELGGILNVMYLNRFFYGFDTWKDFVEQDNLFEQLRIKLRTADNLRAISTRAKELGLRQEDCAHVGYTKLSMLLPVLNRENAKDLMKEAASMKSKDLSVKVRKQTGRITEEGAKDSSFLLSFKVFEEQRDLIEKALEIAQGVADSDARGHLLSLICADFVSSSADQGDTWAYLRNLIATLETTMKVKIPEVIRVETGEILER